MSFPAFERLAGAYAALWAKLEPSPEHATALRTICTDLLVRKSTYEKVSQAVWGGPDFWFIPAILDQMEHDPDRGLCNSHLHNGDSLQWRTVHIPAARPPAPAQPPFTFLASAIDALTLQGLDKITEWPPARLAYEFERYNGMGYMGMDIENPYLAAWSPLYTKGKYDRDGHYDPELVSGQPGALTILKVLVNLDPTVAATIGAAKPQEPSMSTVPVPASLPSIPAPLPIPFDVLEKLVLTVLPVVGGAVPGLGPWVPVIQIVLNTLLQATPVVRPPTAAPPA